MEKQSNRKEEKIQARYTDAQKCFLALDPKKLTAEEHEMLRVLLLPRTNFLPDSDEECASLAREFLGEQLYSAMRSFCGVVRAYYDAEECWAKGDRYCKLYYRFRAGGKPLCSLGIRQNRIEVIIGFVRSDCIAFEKERQRFPRKEIQWTYDITNMINGTKRLAFPLTNADLYPHLLGLLAIKRKPNRPFQK